MNFISNRNRQNNPVPIVNQIVIPVAPREPSGNYPFSSLLDRARPTGRCSSCGGK